MQKRHQKKCTSGGTSARDGFVPYAKIVTSIGVIDAPVSVIIDRPLKKSLPRVRRSAASGDPLYTLPGGIVLG